MVEFCTHEFIEEDILYDNAGFRTAVRKRCTKCGEFSVSPLSPTGHLTNHFNVFRPDPVKFAIVNTSSTASGPPSPQGEGCEEAHG